MERTVVVGVTMRPDARDPRLPRLWQNRAYFEALERAGAAVLPFVLGEDDRRLRALYERCDALCIPGGPDVDPARFGAEADPRCHVTPEPEIDDTDFRLLEWADADDRPVLTICRGFQVHNVVRGGTLWQDIGVERAPVDDHDGHGRPRDALLHPVRLDADSRLAAIAGATEVEVNSLHHQGVRDLGAGLRATGWSPDGLVEAFEDDRRTFCVGVQFHPEELVDTVPWAPALFDALIAAARR